MHTSLIPHLLLKTLYCQFLVFERLVIPKSIYFSLHFVSGEGLTQRKAIDLGSGGQFSRGLWHLPYFILIFSEERKNNNVERNFCCRNSYHVRAGTEGRIEIDLKFQGSFLCPVLTWAPNPGVHHTPGAEYFLRSMFKRASSQFQNSPINLVPGFKI